MVPHSCLEKADGRTRKKHNMKFRHIGYNVDPYGQSFFPKCISAWNGVAQEIAEANTLDLFKSKIKISTLDYIRLHADLSAIIFVKETEYFSEQKNINRQALCFGAHTKVQISRATIAHKIKYLRSPV